MKYFIAVLVLVCAVQALAQSNGDIRLAEGVSSSMGRVQLYFQGQWGAICVDFGSSRLTVAHVICRSLGFSDSRPIMFHLPIHPRQRILLDRVLCKGNESHILQCAHAPFGESDCTHYEEMAVDCYGGYIGSTVELRNGTTTDGVLVLGNNHGEKGTVCRKLWRFPNAFVACRALGVDTSSISPISLDRAYYGETTETSGLSYLSSILVCHGNETNLTQCDHIGRYLYDMHDRRYCPHSGLDVALDCHGSGNIQVSLIDGNDTWGLVHVVYRGESYAICGEPKTLPAKVVCRMLGYGDHQGFQSSRKVPSGIKTFHLHCTGSEKNIAECGMHLPFEKYCHYALAIRCLPQPDIAVRLVDGNDHTFGRLEIQRNGQWGGACEWPNPRGVHGTGLAMVACRMLQNPTENADIRIWSTRTHRPLVAYSVVCAGDEDNLNYCDLVNRPTAHCPASRGYDAWINCA